MADGGVHMAEADSNDGDSKESSKMDATIFEAFARLSNEQNSTRIDAGLSLLKHLHTHSLEQEEDKECKYALTRIIRSLGSSKTHYRKGSYATLTVFLSMHPETTTEKVLAIVEHELHPASSNNKGENASIYMGRLLAYGALIRSKILLKSSTEQQLQVLQGLLQAGRKRSYLSLVSTCFLVEYLNQIESDKSLLAEVWPVLEEEFGKPWSEQTLDSLYVLLIIKNKFPKLCSPKFLKKHLNVGSIVAKENMDEIVRILMDLPRIVSCHHPIYKLFCESLTTTELVAEFWARFDQKFEKPSKTDEHLAVAILRLLLQNLPDKSTLSTLLSPNILQHMLRRFSYARRHENDEVLSSFREILNQIVAIVNSNESKPKTRISVLKRLILYPGDLMIEKRTGTKVIQTITGAMSFEGVKRVSKIYREIVENTLPKERQNARSEGFWTNAERTYAVQLLTRLMGHPASLSDHEWRLDQLKFLFSYGLCEMPNVGADLAPSIKESFYRALDCKLPKLNDLRNILSSLVHHISTKLTSGELKLRTPLSDEAKQACKKVLEIIEKLEQDSTKPEILPVFHTMNLHMGLQLFSDPEMAITSINELQSCYERITKRPKRKKSMKGETEEPEWVEVVVDLLLSLLSRNNHLLRSLVGCVFPHICPYVTPTAIHDILAALDVKNDKGPLVAQNGLDDEDSQEESSDESSNEEDDDQEDQEDQEDEEEEDTEDDQEDEDETEEEEDETMTERIRLAVQQALGDAVPADGEDVDVDQIGEDEGKRLDESLAAAFKMLRENRHSKAKRQERTAQAVMHFRIRVLDLLDTYLDSEPSMPLVLDLIVPLFALLEYCIKDPHQTPLQHRVRSCLKKLAGVKKFRDLGNVDQEVLILVLRSLIEKGERTTSVCQEMNDKLAQCTTFLIRCSQQAGLPVDGIIEIFGENLTAFFKKRDCVLPPVLFKNVLQLQWEGNWHLAPLLVDFAFDPTVRSFRRGHALEFLTVFYNNGRLVRSDKDHLEIRERLERRLFENSLNMFKQLSDTDTEQQIGKGVKQRFVCLLFTLLRIVYSQHLPRAWDWKSLGDALASYRGNAFFAKDTKSAYNKLASQIGVKNRPATKKPPKTQASPTNGKLSDDESMDESNEDKTIQENGNTDSDDDQDLVNNTKRKKKDKRKSQLLKKEARLLREKKMSEGFTEFRFSTLVEASDASQQNGEASNEVKKVSKKSTQKRTLSHTKESGNRPKRKKSLDAA